MVATLAQKNGPFMAEIQHVKLLFTQISLICCNLWAMFVDVDSIDD